MECPASVVSNMIFTYRRKATPRAPSPMLTRRQAGAFQPQPSALLAVRISPQARVRSGHRSQLRYRKRRIDGLNTRRPGFVLAGSGRLPVNISATFSSCVQHPGVDDKRCRSRIEVYRRYGAGMEHVVAAKCRRQAGIWLVKFRVCQRR